MRADRKRRKFVSKATPTTDLEQAQGDGCTVRVGRMVYQPPKQSPTWGLVPSRTGEVVRVYVREGESRTLVDTHNGHTLEADKCRRSSAAREETEIST